MIDDCIHGLLQIIKLLFRLGGILSLAHATAQAGWSGLGIIVYCAILAAIAGIALAKCWLILEERYPEYRHGLTRKPFSTIGYHAFGNWARYAVTRTCAHTFSFV